MTVAVLASVSLPAADLSAQGRQARPMTFEDFAAVRNVGDPQISPDGKWVLYSLRTTDVGANRRTTVTVLAPVSGGVARQFPNANTKAAEARWSPDGKRVAYGANGQLWIADVSGGNARQVTNVNG
ncbi:MAG TPA: DPP IV N-terminal domain-containing protein, partial [Gemmatimonadaceae bacterium]